MIREVNLEWYTIRAIVFLLCSECVLCFRDIDTAQLFGSWHFETVARDLFRSIQFHRKIIGKTERDCWENQNAITIKLTLSASFFTNIEYTNSINRLWPSFFRLFPIGSEYVDNGDCFFLLGKSLCILRFHDNRIPTINFQFILWRENLALPSKPIRISSQTNQFIFVIA